MFELQVSNTGTKDNRDYVTFYNGSAQCSAVGGQDLGWGQEDLEEASRAHSSCPHSSLCLFSVKCFVGRISCY